jgi:methylenetetrahydrofolate--tRNA-(uracil-5-)-methyltransferase
MPTTKNSLCVRIAAMPKELTVVGGGLAGSEAAWQAAEAGIHVFLYEMRPTLGTPAHATNFLAELVCSNSLGSTISTKAPGLLKAELRGLGSLIISCAEQTAVPAGSALAVDRDLFAQTVTERIEAHPNIELIRQEVTEIPEQVTIIATGPLTSAQLTDSIGSITGRDYLYFYDALSPIVSYETINLEIAYRASRHDQGIQEEGDYINCPLDKETYDKFYRELVSAEQITLRGFEREDASFFEGCLPVEEIARRGRDALRFGPLRPIGLTDSRTGDRPHAVIQLRQDNLAGTLFNIVGFQTNLKWGEQRRVLRLVPGLENAEFMRYGMMHRNTYINSPELLQPTMQYRGRADLFFAGQIVGAEGYVGNAATGLVAGLNGARLMLGEHPVIFPTRTMIGSLCHYVTHAEAKSFQPMKPNFGLLPMPEERMPKSKRYQYYRDRSLKQLRRFCRDRRLEYNRGVAETV